ncbi:MAG TPA: restriction endonuclease subunit S [Tenuifilaceae bacterium]|nr:restriction endonuclease subunit S [Tenuifilaceae bacterium]HPN22275.1 restriction endonuclease subunit S [Tenuifilaceae bacterium]
MEVKQGYKETEIGIIPEDWEVDFIRNFAIIKTGSRNTQDNVSDGIYPFFVRSQKVERINSFSYEGEAVLTAGDGVGVGKVVHYINGKFDCHQRVYRITDFNEKINGYFFYLYFSSNFLNRIMQMTAKSSVDSVRMDMIADMQVPIPPTKTEQTAIATALSDTDALIESLEKLIAKKRLIKQGAMQELLKPKEGWEVKRLGDVVFIRKGQIITESTAISGNIPVIAGGKTPAYFHNRANRFGKTITISGSGASAGYVAFHNYPIFASDCSTIEENKDYSVEYVFYLLQLNQDKIYKMQTGGAQPHIHPSDLNPIEIPFPKKEKQEQIAKILSDMDKEIEALEAKLEKYRKIKVGMMQQLLTGKIRLV